MASNGSLICACLAVVVWPRVARDWQGELVLDGDLMPAVDGEEVVACARASPGGRRAPVVRSASGRLMGAPDCGQNGARRIGRKRGEIFGCWLWREDEFLADRRA